MAALSPGSQADPKPGLSAECLALDQASSAAETRKRSEAEFMVRCYPRPNENCECCGVA
jgi:hypothetical protein